jgi:hypothetical protein
MLLQTFGRNYHGNILAHADVNFISQANKAELSNRLQYKLLSNSTFIKSPKPTNLLCLKWYTILFRRCEQLPIFWRSPSPSNLPTFKTEAAISLNQWQIPPLRLQSYFSLPWKSQNWSYCFLVCAHGDISLLHGVQPSLQSTQPVIQRLTASYIPRDK